MKTFNIPIAAAVTLAKFETPNEKERFEVSALIYDQARGYEYRLTQPGRGIVRVCHAPQHEVASARAGGEIIEYEWRAGP